MQVLEKYACALQIKPCTGYPTRLGLHLHVQKKVPKIQILFDPMAAPHSTSSAKPDNDQICIYASFVEFQQVSGCINKFQVASTPEPNTTAIRTFSKKAGQINMHARYLGQGHVKDVETVCMHWPYEHRSE